MIKYVASNLAKSTLDLDISASATSITLKAGDGALFPDEFPFLLKFEKFVSSAVTKREIVKVTWKSGDTLSIVRAWENCPVSDTAQAQTKTAQSFSKFDSVTLIVTAQTWREVQDEVESLWTNKLNKNWGLRIGMTANKIMSTDPSGNEAYINPGSLWAPTWSITMYCGATAPTLYLMCDWSAVSRTLYADLFAVIGLTYGSWDGTTTFNLPNMKGRVPVGLDATQTEFNTIWKTGGAKTHTLSINEMPTHHHSIKNQWDYGWSSARGIQTWSDSSYGWYTELNPGWIPYIQDTGGGQAHNNLQPYMTFNFIIKT